MTGEETINGGGDAGDDAGVVLGKRGLEKAGAGEVEVDAE